MLKPVQAGTSATEQAAANRAATKAPSKQNAVPQDTVTLSRQAQAQQASAGDQDHDNDSK
ncbi:MAG TPA: hypothetical protein VFA74_00055 [Terriglobales bacterium]|nr:hypothetical protein [Terriglobales bacterium]